MNILLETGQIIALLDNRGVWSCPDHPHWATALNTAYGPASYPPSPAAGSNAYAAQARAAQKALGGKLIYETTEHEDHPDRVY